MSGVRQLSPAEAHEWFRTEPDARGQWLDVRERWEYDLARLPGAYLIPLSELPSRLHELDPQQPLIVYCHHGIRSWHAACMLYEHGFRNVANLAGGIDAWSRLVDPSLPRY